SRDERHRERQACSGEVGIGDPVRIASCILGVRDECSVDSQRSRLGRIRVPEYENIAPVVRIPGVLGRVFNENHRAGEDLAWQNLRDMLGAFSTNRRFIEHDQRRLAACNRSSGILRQGGSCTQDETCGTQEKKESHVPPHCLLGPRVVAADLWGKKRSRRESQASAVAVRPKSTSVSGRRAGGAVPCSPQEVYSSFVDA